MNQLHNNFVSMWTWPAWILVSMLFFTLFNDVVINSIFAWTNFDFTTEWDIHYFRGLINHYSLLNCIQYCGCCGQYLYTPILASNTSVSLAKSFIVSFLLLFFFPISAPKWLCSTNRRSQGVLRDAEYIPWHFTGA